MPKQDDYNSTSAASRLCRPFVRAIAARVFRPDVPVTTQRRLLAAFTSPPPLAVSRTPWSAAGVRGVWLRPGPASRRHVILYLHGGGYCLGGPAQYAELAGRIALAANADALLLDYRLAPAHPFPAALDDALAAYQHLRATLAPATRLTVVGDSAGGGLAVALAVLLRDRGDTRPDALVTLSAWTDLCCTGASMLTRATADPLFTAAYVRHMAQFYPGGASPRLPLISPRYADLAGLPPLLVQVGGAEILLDDSLSLAALAQRAGVAVTLEVWPAMWHVWQLTARVLPEGRRAIARIGSFLRHQTASSADAKHHI